MNSVRKLVLCELVWCLLSLLVPSGQTIEVHEDVNEGPIGAHLRLNVSTEAPPTKAMADGRNVNDPPPALPPGGNDNYTTTAFPSNHRQHSGANIPTASSATTEAEAPATTTTTTSISSLASGPSPPAASSRTPTGLSSFRAANSAIVNDRSAQHQISSYRKRQLYASAVLQRNSSHFQRDQGSEGQFTKEFVPSPEVVPFFNEESSQGNFMPTSVGGVVDAPYPSGGLTEGDSKWYAGYGPATYTAPAGKAPARPAVDRESSGKWDRKFPTWQRHPSEPNVVHFPQDARTAPVFPSPKGKWKWIPEDDNEGASEERPAGVKGKPVATPFSSSASAGGEASSIGSSVEEQQLQQPYFGKYYFTHPTVKNHPYSFDRTPGEGTSSPTAFSSDGGTVSTNVISGANSSETGIGGEEQSNGTTDLKLVGKEDGHLKSSNVSPWKKIIHVLSAAIPIGLLISALTPQVVYINPNATQ
ncbi:uncharacterized protein LOC100879214 [Anopheles sinensis]|uniref:Uncharacterized protein LOC100879214 n=1 Tax=Anopheles sinensis TaxID=74873 RepID=A0A084VAM4_ANOSI|nr:uncharacterized protein LOC100879214 [Anopheles sinensis]